MPVDLARWRRFAAVASVVAVAAAALAGGWAFVLSLRPCRIALVPGTVVDYRLRTEYREQIAGQAGPPKMQESRITLVCIGRDNEVALVSPDGGHGEDGISLMSFATDGTARVHGPDGPGEEGKALGFFDFNLLPLPPGSEQDWKVSLVYAALPPGKRQVLGRVKRTANSAHPEFELRLPTVEWVNEHDRYVQVRSLVCRYRFDPNRGVVDRAVVECETGIERADDRHTYRVTVSLDLLGIQHPRGDVAALQDLALAGVEAQQAVGRRQLERLEPLAQRLEQAGVQAPALRGVIEGLRGRDTAGGTSAWWLRGPRWPVARRPEVDALRQRLASAGWPVRLAASAEELVLWIGPATVRDDRWRTALAGLGTLEWVRR